MRIGFCSLFQSHLGQINGFQLCHLSLPVRHEIAQSEAIVLKLCGCLDFASCEYSFDPILCSLFVLCSFSLFLCLALSLSLSQSYTHKPSHTSTQPSWENRAATALCPGYERQKLERDVDSELERNVCFFLKRGSLCFLFFHPTCCGVFQLRRLP